MRVGVSVRVGVFEGVNVAVGVLDGVNVAVFVGVSVGVFDEVTVGDGVKVNVVIIIIITIKPIAINCAEPAKTPRLGGREFICRTRAGRRASCRYSASGCVERAGAGCGKRDGGGSKRPFIDKW